MTPLDKLIGLALAAMGLDTGSGFERRMLTILTRTYTAAYLVATAERLGVSVDTLGGLSQAERADIKAAIAAQLPYLAGFAAAYAALSAAQRAARMTLYAASVRPFYFEARWGGWDIDAGLWPGRQICRGNCRCEVSIDDHGDGTGVLTRTLGATDNICVECQDLAGDYEIRRRRR